MLLLPHSLAVKVKLTYPNHSKHDRDGGGGWWGGGVKGVGVGAIADVNFCSVQLASVLTPLPTAYVTIITGDSLCVCVCVCVCMRVRVGGGGGGAGVRAYVRARACVRTLCACITSLALFLSGDTLLFIGGIFTGIRDIPAFSTKRSVGPRGNGLNTLSDSLSSSFFS